MNSLFPVHEQPLLRMEHPDEESLGRKTQHPHGWSREITMLHEVGEILHPDQLSVSPLYFEIGCGHGEFIERQAKQNPQGYYIGVENVPYYAISAAKRVQQASLTNVLIVNQNANKLLEQVFPEESLDAIFLLYPDPWPKKRHRKRRLIREETSSVYHRVLKSGGQIKVWTDAKKWVELSSPYLEQLPGSLQKMEVSNQIEVPRTIFERKAVSNNRAVYYIQYTKK